MDRHLLKLALGISAGFEGGGFDNVAGNFDGQGVSAGILQWNLGQGTLQPLLKKYGPTGDALIDQVARLAPTDAIALVDAHWTPEWKAKWKALMGSAWMTTIQLGAAEPIGAHALKLQVEWGMTSNQSFCWFFDVCVQNGSLKIPKPDETPNYKLANPKNLTLWGGLTLTAEQICLMSASYERAIVAREGYQADIFNRKGTIAAGTGYVHGKLFHLGF